MTDRACEVCGEPATAVVADLREGPPATDQAGKLWRTYAVESTHLFCDAHWREPKGAPAPPPGAAGLWLIMGRQARRRGGPAQPIEVQTQ